MIRCPKCGKNFRNADSVILDVNYTFTHAGCYEHDYMSKDQGRFVDLVGKYSAFEGNIVHRFFASY
ncbi:hypothetical protein [Aquibacillus sediminis]|uniref:hypothetical protein n=1 Tax=Aquibacillus sediminis TaxID=2574734 RepID=UPI0011093D24|nr:hypothetical protein [Aquibacillus sediminis]